MKKHSLLIVEDHALLRETWKLILNKHPSFKVIATCGSGEEAITLARDLQPELVMMDITLKGMDGVAATAQLKKQEPAVKILCVSLHNSSGYVKKIMAAGASGYVTKNASQEELIQALLTIADGKKFLSGEIKTILSDQVLEGVQQGVKDLTYREVEIIDLIKKGLSSKEIGESLSLSVKTVEVHRYNILRKLKLKNTAALVNFINQHAVR